MPADASPRLAQLEAEATRAAQAGREADAVIMWTELLAAQPDHVGALTGLGLAALRRRDHRRALPLLERATAVAPDNLMGWINLAMARQLVGDLEGEIEAVTRALICDPMDLIALVMKSRIFDRTARPGVAAQVHAAVLAVAPPMERLSPDLRRAVEHSRNMIEANNRELETFLNDHLSVTADRRPKRFNEAVAIMLGKQKRYQSEPALFYFPQLAPTYFFEENLFPWLQDFKSETPAIIEEFEKVHAEDRGFTPYTAYGPDKPLNQWKELNNSTRWNAFHLLRNGVRLEENASRCPRTMALLAHAPQPQSANRSPNAMFSLLAPRTKIPPHTGVVNTRLVVHVPLIIPDSCGFRVGAEVRSWRIGEALVFDDTIEHEAWNDSDQLRVVLIFDIWRPDLSEEERGLLVELMAAIDLHNGENPTGGL